MAMIDIKEEIIEQLEVLPYERQCRVLDFTRRLAERVQVGVPGRHLLHFAGTIRADDLQIMKRAIEDGCKRINTDEW